MKNINNINPMKWFCLGLLGYLACLLLFGCCVKSDRVCLIDKDAKFGMDYK